MSLNSFHTTSAYALKADSLIVFLALGKKVTIHQLSIMLSPLKNGIFPGHNHLLTTGAVDPSFGAQAMIKVKGHQHQWLAGGYDLEIGHF